MSPFSTETEILRFEDIALEQFLALQPSPVENDDRDKTGQLFICTVKPFFLYIKKNHKRLKIWGSCNSDHEVKLKIQCDVFVANNRVGFCRDIFRRVSDSFVEICHQMDSWGGGGKDIISKLLFIMFTQFFTENRNITLS